MWKPPLGSIFAAASTSLLLAASAPAATLCVEPGGGMGCYTTIGLALAAALPDDEIQVAEASYVENVVIDKNVTVEGGWDATFTVRDPVGQPTTILPLDATMSVVTILGSGVDPYSSTPTLDGFVITGGLAALGFNHGGGLRVIDSHATVSNNVIANNRAFLLGGGVWVQRGAPRLVSNRIEFNVVVDNDSIGAGVMLENSQAVLADNTILQNTIEMAAGSGLGGGVGAQGGDPVTVHGGLILNNSAGVGCQGRGGGLGANNVSLVRVDAVHVVGNCAASGSALFFENAPSKVTNSLLELNAPTATAYVDIDVAGAAVLQNNTLDGAAGLDGVHSVADLTISNNIFMDFQNAVVAQGAAGVSSKTNDFWNNVVNNVGFLLDASDLLVDPLLDGTHHLTAPSPLIDAGTRTDGPFGDIDGEPRPMAVLSSRYRMDIGADEFTGAEQHVTDLDLESADLTIIGPGNPPGNPGSTGTNDWIGYSVLADDVNADGQPDLLIGAQDWAEDFDDLNASGRVFGLFNFGTPVTGTIDLAVTTEDLTVVSEMELQHVGERLLGADLNDDDDGDLIVASTDMHATPGLYPTVFAFFGAASFAGEVTLANPASADFALIAPEEEDRAFATRNAVAVGDVSGDGVEDLIVGDAVADDGATLDTGAAFVVFGAAGLAGVHDLAVTPADFTFYGAAAAAGLGSSSDGGSDGAVGVGLVDTGGQLDLVARTTTTAYVLLGPLASGSHHLSSTAADITVSGLAGGGILVMDLTGDGAPDLLLGSGNDIVVIPGPLSAGQNLDAATAAAFTLTGGRAEAMRSADFLGDPRPDLIVGVPGSTAAYVVAGGLAESGSVPLEEVAEKVVVGAGQKNLGWDVGGGDLDLNGRADLVVSSWQLDDPGASAPEFQDVGKTFVFYAPEPHSALVLIAGLGLLLALEKSRRQ